MFPNYIGLLCVVLAVGAFFAAYLWGRKIVLPKRIAVACAAVILALPAVSYSLYYLHLVDVPAWYYQFRSISGTELFIVMLGVAGGMLASCIHKYGRLFILAGVLAFALAPFMKPFVAPFKDGVLENKWEGEVCMQSTGSTCGAASLATICKSYGIAVEEQEIAREAHSYRRGTEAWYIARAARARGLEATFESHADLPKELNLPAIAGVKLGGVGHFIPLIKREGEVIVIGDSLHGREEFTYGQLKAKYRFTGFFMLLEKEQ